MRQEVNLYRLTARPSGWLTTRRIGQIAGALAGLLLLHSGVRAWQAGYLDRELSELDGRRNEMAARLEESKRENVAPQVAALREELAGMAAAHHQRIQVLDRLKKGGFGNLSGFSPYLRSLAQQRVNGMWLTEVRLGAGGAQLTLGGYAMADALIPDFLQRLHAETPLSGITFRHILLMRTERADAPVKFELSTEAQDAAREKRP